MTKKSKEKSLHELWDTVKQNNICIMVALEGREHEEGSETLLKEIMNENFPNLGKEMDIQVHEACKSPNRFTPQRTGPRHINIKLKVMTNYFESCKKTESHHSREPP